MRSVARGQSHGHSSVAAHYSADEISAATSQTYPSGSRNAAERIPQGLSSGPLTIETPRSARSAQTASTSSTQIVSSKSRLSGGDRPEQLVHSRPTLQEVQEQVV